MAARGRGGSRIGAAWASALVVVVATAAPSWSVHFNPKHFSGAGVTQNANLPLVPGTKYVYRGTALENGQTARHRLVVVVTDQTKVVDGVEASVVWEKDYSNGFLEESELAFYAVDDKGNVWSLGEYPQEYDRGRFDGAPNTWIAGQDGARPGLLMPANPRLGTPAYVQGYAPAVEFKDKGKVYATGQQTCVPAGCFDNVLVIEESNALDPAGGHQLKYHAPGVGVVGVGTIDSNDQERLRLAKLENLAPGGRARVDGQVTRLDRHAYGVAPDVYSATQPISGRTVTAADAPKRSHPAGVRRPGWQR